MLEDVIFDRDRRFFKNCCNKDSFNCCLYNIGF